MKIQYPSKAGGTFLLSLVTVCIGDTLVGMTVT
jgi:hypothetical protein